MEKVSDFLVMEEMSKQNADIKAFIDCVEIKKVKKGGHITMGLDPNTAEILLAEVGQSMMDQKPAKHAVVLYVVDMEVFNKLKKSMGDELPSS